MRRTRAAIGASFALALLVLAGCGGGQRQDANEPSGTFPVDVVGASFPSSQHLAVESRMRISVRNTGRRTIPDVAVTVDGLNQRIDDPRLADQQRPVWVVDNGPTGGDTVYVGTWALGALRPHQTAVFEWALMPVATGRHMVHYEVSAGLNGKAKARTASGGLPGGSFQVAVSGKPAQAIVDPNTGKVIREGK